MYISIAIPALYVGASYFYNQYKQANFRPKVITGSVLVGNLIELTRGITADACRGLDALNEGSSLQEIEYVSNLFSKYNNLSLRSFIDDYGVNAVKEAISSIFSAQDYDVAEIVQLPLKYYYLPYNQLIITSGSLVAFYDAVGFNTMKMLGLKAVAIYSCETEDYLDTLTSISEYGYEIITPLKESGFDFSKLDKRSIVHLINQNDEKIIPLLKGAGVDFSKLVLDDIVDLINYHGEQIITPLKENGFDFSKLDATDISYLIKYHGKKITLAALKGVGCDLSNLDTNDIDFLIKHHGEKITLALKEAGEDPSNLSTFSVINNVNQGLQQSPFHDYSENQDSNTELVLLGDQSSFNSILHESFFDDN